MRKILLFALLLIVVVTGGVAVSYSSSIAKQTQTASAATDFGVGALGRIDPQSEVIKVNAPSTMEPAVVQQLTVEVGQKVERGQILAVLDSNQREQADVEKAKASLLLAERSLARVKAGAKQGEINAQQALVDETNDRITLAVKQLERVRKLVKTNASPLDDLDVRESEVEVLRKELRQRESTLVALREIRPVDVDYAEADVAKATAELQRAEADLEISIVRSPIAGEVLRIHCRSGERVGSDGLLDLGDTREMDVVAEVHESDILKVKLQQPATIFLRNLDRTLQGHVIELGRLVGRKDVLSNDPVEDTDARVIEVRIRLNDADGQLVAGMSYAKVEVTIDTNSPATSDLTSEGSTFAGKE